MTELMRVVASGDLECPTHAVRPVRPRLPRRAGPVEYCRRRPERTVLYQVVPAYLET